MQNLTLEDCKALAKIAGLTLPDEELQRLIPGINRLRKQASELREMIDPGAEPALSFAAAAPKEKK